MAHLGLILCRVSLMAEAPTLVSELQDFRANFTDHGNTVFGARVGRHDDLVLAMAIAAWYAVARDERRVMSRAVVGHY